MKKTIILLQLALCSATLSSQGIYRFIDSVRLKNPEIISIGLLTKSAGDNARTGIYPANPEVSFGYFPGKPKAIGHKTTWSLTQTFDFPGVYKRLRDIRDTDIKLAGLEGEKAILQLLNNSRKEAISYIALLKKKEILDGRLADMARLEKAYEKMLSLGEITSLEYNKIEMQSVAMNSEYNDLTSEIASMRISLDYISGGLSSLLDDAAYPSLPEPQVGELLSQRRGSHPAYLIPVYLAGKAKQELRFNSAARLPGITVGVASESVPGETYVGPAFGLTIPLWENKGRMKAARSKLEYQEASALATTSSLDAGTRSQFSSFESIKKNIEIVSSNLQASKSVELLNQGLNSGNITLTDYLFGLQEYYHIEDLYLDLTEKYNLLLSDLWDNTF